MWEDLGKQIMKISLPLVNDKNVKAIEKCYEAADELKCVKKVTERVKGETKDALMVVDEPKYIKILLPEQGGKLKMVNEYFVYSSFGQYDTIKSLAGYGYASKMLYTTSGAYLL